MTVAGWAVRRPVAVGMAFLALSLLGGVSGTRLPVNLLPDIQVPQVVVYTSDPEAGPAEVERRITQPIEAALAGLPRVDRVSSISQEGVSLVTVRFGWGTQMDPALLDVRERLDSLRDILPRNARRPRILRVDPESEPILILSLSGGDPVTTRAWAETVLRRRLEPLDGIAQAQVTGGVEREIQVEVDLERLQGFGVTLSDLAFALDRANQAGVGGTIREGQVRVPLRAVGEFRTLQEVEAVVISPQATADPSATWVRVRDVARVVDGWADREEIARHGGREAVGVLLFKESGANTVRAAAQVGAVLGQLRREAPATEVEVVSSQADFIRAALSNVISAVALGGVLALGVLFLFLGEPRSPLLLALALPVSVLGTFGLMDVFGVSLNLMSLGGMALGVGMWVDNAIIVLESVARHEEEGKAPLEAAERGAGEVSGAMAASTLTTIGVFLPLLFVRGVAGELFRDLALTVTFSLLVSLGVAQILLPALAPRFARRPSATSGGRRFFWRIHAPILAVALARPRTLIAGSLILLGVAGVWGSALDRNLFPAVDAGAFEMELTLPRGTPLERTHAVAERLEAELSAEPGVAAVFTSVGRDPRRLARTGESSGSHRARFQVRLSPGSGTEAARARLQGRAEGVRREMAPEGKVSLGAGRTHPLGFLLESGERGLTVRILGEDLEAARAHGERLERVLTTSGSGRLRDLSLPPKEDRPQLYLEVLRDEAARSGVPVSSLVELIERGMSGAHATDFVQFDQRIPIRVRLPRASRENLETLDHLTLEGVPVRRWIEVVSGEEPNEIRREGQARVFTLRAEVARGGLDAALRELQGLVAAHRPPEPSGLRVEVGGEGEEMRRAFRELTLASLLAIVLVYMLLAAHFESLLLPWIVLATVPLSAIGAIGALGITGTGLNALSLIGFVVLIGIVVNDAIVKIDHIERARGEGMNARSAVLEAGRVRLRPILMTTATTLVGLLPMTLGRGPGADLRRPLATALLGGLTTATLLTLVVVPVLYEVVDRFRRGREG
jgi:hydrophobic/amphiphilic exporter-1 (mainly G- bacteria), HAE1 family